MKKQILYANLCDLKFKFYLFIDNSSKSDANKGNVRVLSSRTENSKPILIYDLNNDCLRKSIKEYNENLYDIDPTCSTSSTSSSVINKKSKEKFRFNKNIKNQMTLSDMMVLNTEWTQLETIELLNESSSSGSNANLNKAAQTVINATQIGTSPSSSSSGGFGFGITGNKSTGVVVKAITPGGSAHKVNIYFIFLISIRLNFFYYKLIEKVSFKYIQK